MIYPSRLKEIRELAYEPGTLALLDTKEQETDPINFYFSLRRILDKNIYIELCDEIERLTNINNALESDLANACMNLEHLDGMTSSLIAENEAYRAESNNQWEKLCAEFKAEINSFIAERRNNKEKSQYK